MGRGAQGDVYRNIESYAFRQGEWMREINRISSNKETEGSNKRKKNRGGTRVWMEGDS